MYKYKYTLSKRMTLGFYNLDPDKMKSCPYIVYYIFKATFSDGVVWLINPVQCGLAAKRTKWPLITAFGPFLGTRSLNLAHSFFLFLNLHIFWTLCASVRADSCSPSLCQLIVPLCGGLTYSSVCVCVCGGKGGGCLAFHDESYC